MEIAWYSGIILAIMSIASLIAGGYCFYKAYKNGEYAEEEEVYD